MAYLFVLVPLGLYLPAFIYETYIAFRRLGKKGAGSAYLHGSWEITHTLLVVAVNYFIWLFADIMPTVGKVIYPWLIIAGAAFLVRAAMYVWLFYYRRSAVTGWLDTAFAWLHIAIIAGLVLILLGVITTLATHKYVINSQFVPYMWPGLVLTFAVCAVPFFRTYTTRD